jgi:hypothetical protein
MGLVFKFCQPDGLERTAAVKKVTCSVVGQVLEPMSEKTLTIAHPFEGFYGLAYAFQHGAD